MTAGPAWEIARLEPRNRPVPIAPPLPIMVSCLEFRRRWSPVVVPVLPAVPVVDDMTAPLSVLAVVGDGLHGAGDVGFVVVVVEGQPHDVAARAADHRTRLEGRVQGVR